MADLKSKKRRVESGQRAGGRNGAKAPVGEGPAAGKRKVLHKLVQNDLIERVDYDEYKEHIRKFYGGPQGALLSTASRLSMHLQLGERLLRSRKFDLRGLSDILDVGSGAGQIAGHLLKYADPEARLTCCDLSESMLQRARARLDSRRPRYVSADLTRLPFADGSFDGITCGYVLEHVPEPRDGLSEMARVLRPGGRMFLLVTEDTFAGAWTSRLWRCRTCNRKELREVCGELGLTWKNELWFSRFHEALKAGGICVEIEKAASSVD